MLTLAHYWGIDEIGVFVIPALLAVILLRWAEKKARANRERDETKESSDVD
ncbi:MAG: hypothetical protein WBM90_12965 [Acidimicrobiia bacterium]